LLNADGSTKFPFSWTGNPWRYKDMSTDELSAADREVVEVLMKFTDRLPTKGLVRVYNLVHPMILKVFVYDFNCFNVSKLTNQTLVCSMQDIWLKLGRRI